MLEIEVGHQALHGRGHNTSLWFVRPPALQPDHLRLTDDAVVRCRPYLLGLGPRLVGPAGSATPQLSGKPIRRGLDVAPTLRP